METGRFRDAIAHFKALLKIDDNSQSRAGLGAAYQGRARELAAKGMVKEALAIGEVRRELCPEEPPDPGHLTLLTRAGQATAAVQFYRQAEKRVDPKTFAGMRARLGALFLSGASGLAEAMNPDDIVIVQGVAAREALRAYCQEDDAGVARALAEIPFRSPYRDWARVLKALMAVSQGGDSGEIKDSIRVIAPDSPFAVLASAVRLAFSPDADFLDGLRVAGPQVQQFAATLRGWTDVRLRLWKELQRLGEPPEPKALAALLHRRRELVGEDWAIRRSLSLAVIGAPRGGRRAPPVRTQLNSFDSALLAAWHAEKQRDPWYVFDAWMSVIHHFQTPDPPAPRTDDALRIALIQRRLDSDLALLDLPADMGAETLIEQVRIQLEKSLYYDPDHRPTYIRLASYYRTQRSLKDARRILEPALRQWSDDVSVLGEAMETALAGGAFKKAAGFAREVLALDPINTRARNQLLDAHLAHARKQYGKGRCDLAEQELRAAGEWSNDDKSEAKLGLLRGFVQEKNGVGSAFADLAAWMEKAGGGMTGQLALLREAARLGRQPFALKKRMNLPRIDIPEKEDLLAFLHEVRDALDVGEEVPMPVLAIFRPILKRAARLPLSQGEYEAACETLRRSDQEEARLAYARAALKCWRGLPVFELHAFEAKHEGRYWGVREADIRRLEAAYDRAQASGDVRTAHRLGELIDGLFGSSLGHPGGPTELVEDLEDPARDLDIHGLLDLIRDIGSQTSDVGRRDGRAELREVLEAVLPDEIPIADDIGPLRRKTPRKRGNSCGKSGKDQPADGADERNQLDLFK